MDQLISRGRFHWNLCFMVFQLVYLGLVNITQGVLAPAPVHSLVLESNSYSINITQSWPYASGPNEPVEARIEIKNTQTGAIMNGNPITASINTTTVFEDVESSTNYTVTLNGVDASGSVGDSHQDNVITESGSITRTAYNETTLWLSWLLQNQSYGIPIVTYYPKDGSSSSNSVELSSFSNVSTTLLNLEPGTLYVIELSYNNTASGFMGQRSQFSTKPETGSLVYYPDTPSSVNITIIPASGNVNEYVISVTNRSDISLVQPSDGLSTVVDNLAFNVFYSLSVVSYSNGISSSVVSDTYNRVIVTIEEIGIDFVNISWTQPKQMADQLQLVLNSSDGQIFPADVFLSSISEASVQGLAPETLYNLKLITSPNNYSIAEIDFRTLARMPSSLQLASGSDPMTTIVAYWRPPITGNLDGYVVTYEPADGESASPTTYDSNTVVATLTGLTPSNTYTVTVRTTFGGILGMYISAEFTTASGVEGEIIVKETTTEEIFLTFTGYQGVSVYELDILLSGISAADTVTINSTSPTLSHRFTSLVPGNLYIIRLTVGSMVTEVTARTVPLSPTDLYVDQVTSNTIVISWNASMNVDRYNIFYTFGTSIETRIQANTVTTSPATISTLSPDVEYTLEVVAVSGDKDNVQLSEAVAITARTAIADVHLTATTDTISVTWDPVQNAQNYSVYYFPTDGNESSPSVVDTNELMLVSVTPGERYKVAVEVNFANSTKRIIGISYIRTEPLTPTNIVVTKDVDSFTITWSPPMGSIYSGFNLVYLRFQISTTLNSYTVNIYDTGRSHTVTGLVAGNQYFWSLHTVSGSSNDLTVSVATAAESSSFILDTPVAGEVFIETVTETTIELSFHASTNVSRTGYELTLQPPDSTGTNNRTFTSTEDREHVFLGLVPGTEYTVMVSVLSTNDPDQFAKVTTKPLVPRFVQISNSTISGISLIWDQPLSTANFDYYRVSYRPNIGNPVSPIIIDKSGNRLRRNADDSVTLEITGLMDNAVYDITVSTVSGNTSQDVFITALTGSLSVGEFIVTNVTYDSFQVTYGETIDPALLEYKFIIIGNGDTLTITRSVFEDRYFLVENLNDGTLYSVEFQDGVNPAMVQNITTESYFDGDINITSVSEKSIQFIWKNSPNNNYVVSFGIEPDEGTAVISEASNEGTVSGLTPGRLYWLSIFNTTGTNQRVSPIAVRTYPERPSAFVGQTLESTSISLIWSINADVVYDFFRVTYAPADGLRSQPIDVTANAVTVEGLIPSTEYSFQIKTISGEGELQRISQLSADTAWSTSPVGMGEVLVRDYSNDSISITWGLITGETSYIIEISPVPSDGIGRVEHVGDRQYDFTGLTPGQLYNISVTGNTTSQQGYVLKRTYPNPVSSLDISNTSLTTLTLNWTEPEVSGGVAVIFDGYVLSYTPDGGAVVDIGFLSNATNSYTVTDLYPTTNYTVKIRTRVGVDQTLEESSIVTKKKKVPTATLR